jgi:hypothetical protein
MPATDYAKCLLFPGVVRFNYDTNTFEAFVGEPLGWINVWCDESAIIMSTPQHNSSICNHDWTLSVYSFMVQCKKCGEERVATAQQIIDSIGTQNPGIGTPQEAYDRAMGIIK